MLSIADLAVRVLARAPARALPVSRLRNLIELEDGDANTEYDHVLQCVGSRPDHFRVLDPWRGPWRMLGPRGPGPDRRNAIATERWVLLLGPTMDSDAAPHLRKLQDSMVAAGRRVDEHSATAMARWMCMTLAMESVVPAFRATEAERT